MWTSVGRPSVQAAVRAPVQNLQILYLHGHPSVRLYGRADAHPDILKAVCMSTKARTDKQMSVRTPVRMSARTSLWTCEGWPEAGVVHLGVYL